MKEKRKTQIKINVERKEKEKKQVKTGQEKNKYYRQQEKTEKVPHLPTCTLKLSRVQI